MNIPEGYSLVVVNPDNQIVDSIDIGGMDLSKSLAVSDLGCSVAEIIKRNNK